MEKEKKINKINVLVYPDAPILSKIERHRFRSGGVVADLTAYHHIRDLVIAGLNNIGLTKQDIQKIAEQTLPVCDSIPNAAFAAVVMEEVKGVDRMKIAALEQVDCVVVLNEIAAWKSHGKTIEWLFDQLQIEKEGEEDQAPERRPTINFVKFERAMLKYAKDPSAFQGKLPRYSFVEDEFYLADPDDVNFDIDFDEYPDA